VVKADDVSRRFEEVARVLEDLDIDRAGRPPASPSDGF